MGLSMPQHWRAGQQLALGLALSQLMANQLVNLNSCLPPGKLHTNRSCRAKAAEITGPRFHCEWDCPMLQCSRTELQMGTVQWPCTTLGGLRPCFELGCRGRSCKDFPERLSASQFGPGFVELRTFYDVHLLYQADGRTIQDAGPGGIVLWQSWTGCLFCYFPAVWYELGLADILTEVLFM